MRQQARTNYLKSIQLSDTLYPRVFHSEEWLIRAKAALERFQAEDRKKTDEEWAKARQPVLDELKDVLDAIKKKHDEGAIKLLRHIYKVSVLAFAVVTRH